jgi:hypothetical protein
MYKQNKCPLPCSKQVLYIGYIIIAEVGHYVPTPLEVLLVFLSTSTLAVEPSTLLVVPTFPFSATIL